MKKILFASATLALCASLSAFANGSGYNGPDLNPISIPVQLDRGISLTALSDAVAECLVVGDSSIGLNSTAQELATQMGASFEPGVTRNISFSDSGLVGVRELSSELTFPEGHGELDLEQYVGKTETGFSSELDLYFTSGPHIGLQLRTDISTAFPLVTFEKVLSEGSFDDFGNLIPSTKLVSGLKIRYAVPPEASLARIPLYNANTKQITKFTLNAEEYVQCLQSQLQLHAAK